MKLNLKQKILLKNIYALIGFFDFLENYSIFLKKLFFVVLRTFALFFIFVTLLAVKADQKYKPTYVFDYLFYDYLYFQPTVYYKPDFPIKTAQLENPVITAQSAIALDVSKNRVLYELNSTESLFPASTTKLMTYMVAKDLYDINSYLTIPPYCTLLDSQKAGFLANDRILIKDLYYALLVGSAGDAACALELNNENFISLMNQKVKDLGLEATSFSNAMGFDSFNLDQYSNAVDLSKLGIAFMQDELAQKIVKTKTYQINSQMSTYQITNTNKLLWEVPQTVGVKTGTTPGAGEVLIYMYKDELRTIEIVVMKSLNRFEDTKAILDWVLKSYSWE